MSIFPENVNATVKMQSNQSIEIVYQHADFYIAYKPENMDFHDCTVQNEITDDIIKPQADLSAQPKISPQKTNKTIGFFNQLKAQTQETLYPVHRLDKATSGLIIVARNIAAEHFFNQAFQQHLINKYYIAIATNKPKQKQGKIIGDMVKSRNKAWKLLRSQNNPAKTHFYSYALGNGKRLYLLKPYSGKTHQLRVAMKSISASILGDDIYKGEASDRLYLHAYALCFEYLGETIQLSVLPKNGKFFKEINFSDPIISDLNQPNQLHWPK